MAFPPLIPPFVGGLTFDWDQPTPKAQPKVGFPCDKCGGKHLKVRLCRRCGKWLCEVHSIAIQDRDIYGNPLRVTHE